MALLGKANIGYIISAGRQVLLPVAALQECWFHEQQYIKTCLQYQWGVCKKHQRSRCRSEPGIYFA